MKARCENSDGKSLDLWNDWFGRLYMTYVENENANTSTIHRELGEHSIITDLFVHTESTNEDTWFGLQG